MKIIDVCAFYTPHGGGVKTYIEEKLRAGARHGHEVVIVAPGREDRVEARPGGGRIVHVASPVLPLDRRYRYFAGADPIHRLLDRERPDLVEASSPWRTASIVADWPGDAPRALVMHCDPMSAYAYRWFGPFLDRASIDRQFRWFWNHLRRAAERSDMVVSANQGLTDRLRAGGLPSVATVPLGIDPGLFSPARRDEQLRATLLDRCGLGADATLLLGIGRHASEKRWPMVVDACRRAGVARPVGLVLIGEGRDGARLRHHIGANPHIHMLAPIRDRALLATVMASGDALIHGCEAETFGLVAAEAAASGLPLIVPNEGGAADFATPATAETFRPADARAAASAIMRLAARDRSALREASVAAAPAVATMESHFARLFGLYAGLVRGERLAA